MQRRVLNTGQTVHLLPVSETFCVGKQKSRLISTLICSNGLWRHDIVADLCGLIPD